MKYWKIREHSLTIYYNGLVISHKRNVNFLVENDGAVVSNIRRTWSQVSFVYVCVCVFLCAYVCVCIYADKIKYLTLHLTLPYFFPCLTLRLTLPCLTLHYALTYIAQH